MASTPVQRLEAAGICKADSLTATEKEQLSKLSDQEVDVLIKLQQKLGPTEEGREAARPNFPI